MRFGYTRTMKKKFYLIVLSILVLSVVNIAGCGANPEVSSVQESTGETMHQDKESVVSLEEESSENATEETEEDEMNATDAALATEIPALRDAVQEVMGCRVGCAVTGAEADDPEVWRIIRTHFNAVTLGNELKPDALFNYSTAVCPGTKEDTLNGETITVPVLSFARAEKILNILCDYNEQFPDRPIQVRGHVLVWHSQTPEWFFHEDYDKNNPYVDKETMNKRLEWYIREVLTHFTGEDSKYKDLFYGWDVVNEAISDNGGKLRTDAEKPEEKLSEDRHGSNSSWYHIYQSSEFIINAFTYANKYAPETLELYYNDYNECNSVKREGIAALLQEIKDAEGPSGEGTRISAMGMQGHYNMSTPAFSDVEYTAKLYGRIVGNVQITEMDLQASDDYDGSAEAKEKEYEAQRKRYSTLYFALRSVNESGEAHVTGITFWGTADHYSWLQSRSNVGGGNTNGLPQCPLLFDEKYEPKPCFWVFAQGKN